MGYVDDVNILLHHVDVKFFVDCFVELATPLGARLNTLKTRIMTSTNGESAKLLCKSFNLTIRHYGIDL